MIDNYLVMFLGEGCKIIVSRLIVIVTAVVNMFTLVRLSI